MIRLKIILGMGLFALFLSFVPAVTVQAQGSNEKLQTYVAQLQNSPDDIALREKIIKLVHSMSSKPENPDGLVELMGQVKYIIHNGTTVDDFAKAAEVYKKASLQAPWLGDVYFNLGVMQEKAGLSKDALVSYSLYLLAKPNAKDKESVKEKIGAMEYASGTTFDVLENLPKDGKERVVSIPVEGVVLIPAGEFWMGSSDGMGNEFEHPRHKVLLRAFYIDRFPVTNRQFKKFVDATGYETDKEKAATKRVWHDPEGDGSGIQDKMDNPVVLVSWNDAQAYVKWAGKRLPTEAEWEKAERGGTITQFFWGNNVAQADDYCWNDENSGGVTHPVGLKKPNVFGLYDIVGNVMEWCSDWYGENYYSMSPKENPKGPDDGKDRVVRGFDYECEQKWMGSGSAYRSSMNPTSGYETYLGFRCAMDAGPDATKVDDSQDNSKKDNQ